MVVMDAVIRLVPGVVGCAQSTEFESFTQNLLEYRSIQDPPFTGGSKSLRYFYRGITEI